MKTVYVNGVKSSHLLTGMKVVHRLSLPYKGNKINYNEKKTAKEKRRTSWLSRYFGQSSRPSSGDLMKYKLSVFSLDPPKKDGLTTVRNIGKPNSLVVFFVLFFLL